MNTRIRGFLVSVLFSCLLAASAPAADHTVTQVGLTFVPNDISINVGDTVEWIWATGSHTVTNGTGFSDPNLGILFDAPLNAANPSFSFTFLTPGEVPYFCRPHFTSGMTGIVRVQDATPVEQLPVQTGFALLQNTPNPFNPQTTISFSLANDGQARIAVYDLTGRRHTVLTDENYTAGTHTVTWNGRDSDGRAMPSGSYLIRLETAGGVEARKVSLIR